ncbi:hypothetical protein HanLR1_Chr00c0631g0764101 [Helianthus annuus]|nr:hypothetical protein HanLR1_Chr00c0631g0764101 [Helianthus annuus]
MDISCRFQSHVGEVTSSTALKQLTVRSRFDYKALSNTRVVLKVGRRKKLTKLIASSCSSANSGKVFGCELKSCLWRCNKPKCNVCLLKASRGVKVTCLGNDSIAFIDGIEKDVESISGDNSSGETDFGPEKKNGSNNGNEEDELENPSVDELRKVLQKALKELEIAQLNSTMFEEKAQRISESAIALKDEASVGQDNINSVLLSIEKVENEEIAAKEAIQRATMALSLSEARLKVALDSLEAAKECEEENASPMGELEEAVFIAQEDIRECRLTLANSQGALTELQIKKEDLQREVDVLKDLADKAQMDALKAEEDVANIMLLAEEAVAIELEATKRVNDAEIALQKAEKMLSVSHVDDSEGVSDESAREDKDIQGNSIEITVEDKGIEGSLITEHVPDSLMFDESRFSDDSDQEDGIPVKETEIDAEKTKNQTKKPETQKDFTKDSSPLSSPKTLLKKSSRFFSASFFSSAEDDTEFTPTSFFQWLIDSARTQMPKLVLSTLLVGAGFAFYAKREQHIHLLFRQPDIITTSIDEVSSNAKPLVKQIRKLPKRVKS